jgi:hypothetical protein
MLLPKLKRLTKSLNKLKVVEAWLQALVLYRKLETYFVIKCTEDALTWARCAYSGKQRVMLLIAAPRPLEADHLV